MVKVGNSENRPSGAKARRFLSTIYGTTKVVPFQNWTLTTGCQETCEVSVLCASNWNARISPLHERYKYEHDKRNRPAGGYLRRRVRSRQPARRKSRRGFS